MNNEKMPSGETYAEKLAWLFHQLPMFSRVGAAAYKPGLERSIALAAHLGNPHDSWKAIHVAGTNGKGSVSHLMASALQQEGYKVGLYTSPHLVDFRERMRINGRMIPEEKVAAFIDGWRAAADSYADRPSFFELTMMMAFQWFADEKVDYAVIETGMGGRLDSTNIITPLLSVITNISWDHAQFLGDTLGKIAGEKAGIMKPGVPVVIGAADGEVEEVFMTHSGAVGSPLVKAYSEARTPEEAILADICPLKGDYQRENRHTAYVALRKLREAGVPVSDESIREGFRLVTECTGLRGRWQVVAVAPLTIADTGHNEAGLRSNMNQLQQILKQRPGARLHFVIGFVADKDLDHILPLFPKDAEYYLTQAQIPRALPYRELAAKCDKLGLRNSAHPTVAEAYAAAQAAAAPDDIIYIGGSTFIVADFLV